MDILRSNRKHQDNVDWLITQWKAAQGYNSIKLLPLILDFDEQVRYPDLTRENAPGFLDAALSRHAKVLTAASGNSELPRLLHSKLPVGRSLGENNTVGFTSDGVLCLCARSKEDGLISNLRADLQDAVEGVSEVALDKENDLPGHFTLEGGEFRSGEGVSILFHLEPRFSMEMLLWSQDEEGALEGEVLKLPALELQAGESKVESLMEGNALKFKLLHHQLNRLVVLMPMGGAEPLGDRVDAARELLESLNKYNLSGRKRRVSKGDAKMAKVLEKAIADPKAMDRILEDTFGKRFFRNFVTARIDTYTKFSSWLGDNWIHLYNHLNRATVFQVQSMLRGRSVVDNKIALDWTESLPKARGAVKGDGKHHTSSNSRSGCAEDSLDGCADAFDGCDTTGCGW